MATYYWVGGSGTWDASTTTNWAATSGGAGGAGVPNNTDSVIFDANSGTAAVVNVTATAVSDNVNVNKSDINLSLSGSPILCTQALIFTSGTITLNNNILTIGRLSSSNTNVRSIAFGTGNITLTLSNAVVLNIDTATNFSYTGTPNFIATYSGAIGTRTIVFGAVGGTESNSVNVFVNAGADIITTQSGTRTFRTMDFTGFSGTLTNNARTIFGNLVISSGMTVSGGASITTFAATSGVQQITTNANTLDFPITKTGAGSLQLQDNLTLGSTRTFTLTAGALDLVNRVLSTGLFSSSNSNARSIAYGTGNITVTGNAGSVWTTDNATNLSFSGTPNVNFTYAGGTGTRGIFSGFTGGLEANSPNINVTAGTDTVLFYGARRYGNINLTGFSGTWAGENWTYTVFGSLTIPAGTPTATTFSYDGPITFAATSGIKDITTNGVVVPVGLTFNGVGGTFRLQSSLTTPSTYTTTLTNGTLNLNNQTLSTGLFNSSNSNVRTLAFGTGNITLVGNNGTIWNTSSATNLTVTGSRTVNCTYAGAVGTRTLFAATPTSAVAFDFNISAGTDIVATGGVSGLRSLNFTGFSGTFSNDVRIIYGSLTLSAGMTLAAGANATNFFATTAEQITSNGKTMDFPLVFDGIGGVWTCQDALTLGSTRALTLTNGTLNLKAGAVSTVGSFVTTGTNQKFLGSSTPGTQATITDASGVNSASYLTISDSFATGGADWEAFYANNNVDAGNNSNWDFGATPILGTEYTYTLRSFTQPRRF